MAAGRPEQQQQTTFEAHDVWTASWLHVNGVPYLECYRNELGRTRWLFGERARAFDLYLAWRSGEATDTLVPGVALVESYRQMCAVAKDVPSTHRGDGHDEQRNPRN